MTFSRGFHWFLHGTALWAFASLVSTGQMHLPAVVVACPLILLPMLGLSRGAQMSLYVWTFLTLLAFVAAFLNILVMHEVMYSLVYFFLFLEIAKLWTLRKNRDVYQVLILTFFQMVAAAVMTASLGFAFMFLGYAFLVTVTWMLFTIKREAEGTDSGTWERKRPRQRRPRSPIPVLRSEETNGNGPMGRGVLDRGFLYGSVWLTVVLMVGTAGIFLVIPRLSSQRFLSGLGGMRTQKVSGFAEQVDFQTIGNIQLDPTIIGRVQLVDPSRGRVPLPSYLRLRATSLDTYTGRRWRKGRDVYSMQIPYSGPDLSIREMVPEGRRIRQSILLEPDGSSYFMGASIPVRFYFGHAVSVFFDQYNYSLSSLRPRDQSVRYMVESIIPDDPPMVPEGTERSEGLLDLASTAKDLALEGVWRLAAPPLALARWTSAPGSRTRSFDESSWYGRPRPPRSNWRRFQTSLRRLLDPMEARGRPSRLSETGWRLFTALPDIPDMDSVRQLAHEWTRNQTTALGKARMIEHYLQTRYTYTTNIEVGNPELHVTEFLTKSRKGHCEYFATAMALMARNVGIPSRLVTGYYTDEFNEAGDYFIVRRQHAHSWVEAWVEPYGWVTFDPSPPSGVGTARFATGVFAGLQKYIDALRFYWYRHVIDFDIQDQFNLARDVETWRVHLAAGLDRMTSQVLGGQLLLSLRTSGVSPLRTALVGGLVVVGAVLGWMMARELLAKRIRKPTKTRSGRLAIRRQVAYYVELLQTLAALNYRRTAGQTPREFARSVVKARRDWGDFLPVTEAYYRARFRTGEVQEADLARAREFIERIRETAGRKRGT